VDLVVVLAMMLSSWVKIILSETKIRNSLYWYMAYLGFLLFACAVH
jgi:hypothetical protein